MYPKQYSYSGAHEQMATPTEPHHVLVLTVFHVSLHPQCYASDARADYLGSVVNMNEVFVAAMYWAIQLVTCFSWSVVSFFCRQSQCAKFD